MPISLVELDAGSHCRRRTVQSQPPVASAGSTALELRGPKRFQSVDLLCRVVSKFEKAQGDVVGREVRDEKPVRLDCRQNLVGNKPAGRHAARAAEE